MPQANANHTDDTDHTHQISSAAPISREQVERAIDALVDLLDTMDAPDAEPSLGFTESHYNPTQDGPDYAGNANAGDDREVQHDEWEDEDKEPSLGWTEEGRLGHPNSWDSDLEADAGPIRKPRPKSKTGADVFRGTAVLELAEPPRMEKCGMVTVKVRRKGGAR